MNKKNIYVIYSFLLVLTAFLGAKVFAINIGVQLSLNRILLLISPIMFLADGSGIKMNKATSQYSYTRLLLFWVIYSLFLLLIIVKDTGAFFHHLFFLISALITSYFAGKYLLDLKHIKYLLMGFSFVMFFAAIIGVQEMLTGVYLYTAEGSVDYYDMRSAMDSTLGIRVPISIAGNPNDFGMMMLFGALNSLVLVKIEQKKILSFIYFAFALFFSFMVVASQSRSQFISLMLAYAIIIFIMYKRINGVVRILLLMGIVFTSSSILTWLSSNEELYKALITVNLAEEDLVRVNLIKNGFLILLNSMFLGVGVGNIEYYMAQPGLLFTGGVLNIHNWWMEILVSSGVVVFVFYLVIYLNRLKGFYKDLLNYKQSNYYYVALYGFVSMIVFVISSVGSSSIFNSEWVWAFFVLLFLLPELKNKTNNQFKGKFHKK